jgi:hypothetical protein
MDLTKKWVIAFDTMCDGWQCIVEGTDDDDMQPLLYDSKEEAEKEIAEDPEFYYDGEYFIVRADEYIHGRKCIYGEKGGHIAGQKLDENGRIQ